MLDHKAARELVVLHIERIGKQITGGLVVLDEHTVTKPYGWVFFYTSRRWHETRDIKYGIAGNGPVVVLAETGELVPLGTHLEPEELVEEFERKRGLTG
jgi:hypothetical protein